jgi:hypothetical protein
MASCGVLLKAPGELKIMRASKLVLTVATALTGFAAMASGPAGKHNYSVMGSYVEGCTCGAPCKCELTGVEMGCQGVGAFSFTGGSYGGKSLAGINAAYSTKPGDWVVLYIDAPNAAKRATAEAFLRACLGGFGKIEAVKNAKVAVWHKGNMDYATVDGGKIMDLKSQAVMGGDGKTPLMYSNIHDPIHPVVMQGKTISCTYSDGDKKFELKDSNAFFHHHIVSSGKV